MEDPEGSDSEGSEAQHDPPLSSRPLITRSLQREEVSSRSSQALDRGSALQRLVASALALAAVGVVSCLLLQGGVALPSAADSSAQASLGLRQVFIPPTLSLPAELANAAKGEVVNTSEADWKVRHELTSALGWPPALLLHKGENCWDSCNNMAGDCQWCGAGNACCKDGAHTDPPECSGVSYHTSQFYTCVTPARPYAVKHFGQDCFLACNGKSGFCDWCGKGNACCRQGFGATDAEECQGAVSFPRGNAHTCVATTGYCPPGQAMQQGQCVTLTQAPTLTFYGYRAARDGLYPFEQGITMANLPGLMWYLHNQVVTDCPRRFNVHRILRYRVTMKATVALYSQTKRNFDTFVPFEKSKCVDPRCQEDHWMKYGYTVGCTYLDLFQGAYMDASFYSFPGNCPSQDLSDKDPKCRTLEPGGFCREPTGDSDCTWYAEPAGEVSISELEEILDYTSFCNTGHFEYDTVTDEGVGLDFWNGKLDAGRCQQRVRAVHALFEKKYPYLPASLGRPVCDASSEAAQEV